MPKSTGDASSRRRQPWRPPRPCPRSRTRKTIAAAGGIPGNSLVEIDCIAVR